MKKIILSQFVVLLCGTLFAWGNFTVELLSWLQNKPCFNGCVAGEVVVNPFITPCFYGALFFTMAFILSVIMLCKARSSAVRSQNI